MGVSALYENGVLTPVEGSAALTPGKRYRVLTEEEVLALTGDLSWLKAAESAFDFWNNDEDSVYDSL